MRAPSDDTRVLMLAAVSPEVTFLSVAQPGSPNTLYRRSGAVWTGLGPLRASGGVGFASFARSVGDDAQVVLRGAGPAAVVPLRANEPLNLDPKSEEARAFPADFEYVASDGTPAGDLFVVGARHRDAGVKVEGNQALAVHFAPGAATPTVTELPEAFPSAKPERVDLALCGQRGGVPYAVRDAWVDRATSRAYVLGFRDGAWRVASSPSPETKGVDLVGCDVTPDGALWAAFAANGSKAASRIFRLGPDGTWSTVPLPALEPLASKPTLTRVKGTKGDGPWAVGTTPITGEPGLAVISLYATASGEVYVNAVRTAGGSRVAFSDASFDEPRGVVLRTGEPLAGGRIAWEKLAGDVLGSRLARMAAPRPAAAGKRK
jgi:hypothetical protein